MKFRLSAHAASALVLALTFGLALLTAGAHAQSFTLPNGGQNSVDFFSPADQWSGFYAGIHGGVIETGGVPNPFGNAKTFEGGMQFGTNLQFGNLVVGAEAAGTYSHDFRHEMGGGASLKQSWSGSVKARAGVALDQILLYGTLGYGVARLEPNGTVTSGASNVGGMVFGGGAEFALTEQVALRIDYTQSRYNGVGFNAGGLKRTSDIVDHSVRAGLNLRF